MKDALEREQELMLVPMKDLPELATDYLHNLSGRTGVCMEICLTAYTAYAQMVEGLPCKDSLYHIPESELAWWKEKGYTL